MPFRVEALDPDGLSREGALTPSPHAVMANSDCAQATATTSLALRIRHLGKWGGFRDLVNRLVDPRTAWISCSGSGLLENTHPTQSHHRRPQRSGKRTRRTKHVTFRFQREQRFLSRDA